MENVITLIKDNYHRMSRSQKQVADYFCERGKEASFLSAAKIAQVIGVSESTVIRFASFLGYKSFPDFIQNLTRTVLNENHESVNEPEKKLPTNEILRNVMQADIRRIEDTLASTDEASFEKAIELILNAENVYVVGLRTCEPLADLLGFYLSIVRDKVTILKTTSTSEIFEQMIHISSKDAFIGISFPRYSMRTLKAMEFAHDRKAHVIAITDSDRSPMCMYSSCMLCAKSKMISVCDSLTAPVSLINAIIVALCTKRSKEVRKNLMTLEQVWGDYQVYLNDEINFIREDIITEKTPVYYVEKDTNE